MVWWKAALILLSVLIVFSFVHFLAKNKRPVRRALISMLTGVGTLTAVNLASGLTGVWIPVSLLSVLTSLIGGIPGVTLILFLNLFF